MTCGILRPAIGLPMDAPEWDEAELRQALVHELEHVRRGDWCIQLMARSACALYWFHPLAWAAWRQLRLESERACDDAVLRSAERTAYAEQLVSLAPTPGDGVSVFTALQEQLGLKPEAQRAPVDVLVIHSAERPTED